MADPAKSTSGDSSQTVSGDNSGRQSDGWEVLDDLGEFEILSNTWRITKMTLDADGYMPNSSTVVSTGMIGRTVKLTVSDWKSSAGTESAKVSAGNYGLVGMFRLYDYIIDADLIANGATFSTFHGGFMTEMAADGSFCLIAPENNGRKLVIQNVINNRGEEPRNITTLTTLEAVY